MATVTKERVSNSTNFLYRIPIEGKVSEKFIRFVSSVFTHKWGVKEGDGVTIVEFEVALENTLAVDVILSNVFDAR